MSEPSSPDRCDGCGHLHLPNTHTCGYATSEDECCECKKKQPIVINNRCTCSHDRFRHCYAETDGPCSKPDCDCMQYAPVTVETVELPEPDDCADCAAEQAWFEERQSAPPQPERRPPLSVAYSTAGGHLYEVYVPGDASVTAEDGALIIQHPEAQVLAIVRVAPIKEGS